jgi:hypothetical protein
MEPVTSAHPPTLDQLTRAVGVCATDTLLTRLHLALPADTPASCGVHISSQDLVWRGTVVTRSGDDTADALLLAHLGTREGDRFSMLGGADPTAWVKPLRSGHRVVVYGATVLLGLPPIVAEPAIPHPDVQDTVAGLHRRLLTVGDTTDTGVQVRGSQHLITLHRPANRSSANRSSANRSSANRRASQQGGGHLWLYGIQAKPADSPAGVCSGQRLPHAIEVTGNGLVGRPPMNSPRWL